MAYTEIPPLTSPYTPVPAPGSLSTVVANLVPISESNVVQSGPTGWFLTGAATIHDAIDEVVLNIADKAEIFLGETGSFTANLTAFALPVGAVVTAAKIKSHAVLAFGGATLDLTLKSGVTVIVPTFVAGFNSQVKNLTAPQIAAVTDWSNMKIDVADGGAIALMQLYLEVTYQILSATVWSEVAKLNSVYT